MANVMVVFYSRYGATESLALVAGVGVMQGRGLLRLRRLADLLPEAEIAADAEWTANRARMAREYIAPRPIDLEWADAVVHVLRAEDAGEGQAFADALSSAGKRVVAVVSSATRDEAIAAGRTAAQSLPS